MTESNKSMSGQSSPEADATEQDQLLDHSYDGIQEYDNPMPRWWKAIFWGSFFFSLAYLFHYWVGHGTSLADDYAEDLAAANAIRAKEAMSQEISEASLAQVLADAASVSKGAELFSARCVACHLEQGQGSIGPNLTDDHWIHGKGQLIEIYEVVGEGVAAKGMPAWNRQLTPAELRQVVAYVGTLRGTNVPGKAPEGEPIH